MNYKRLYDALISHAQVTGVEGYVERHHIIPHCMGGVDDKSNIVALTAREHFLAHLLLAKIYGGRQLWYAVVLMRRLAPNSRLYAIARKGHGLAASAALKGIPLSPETRLKLSAALKGTPQSAESNAKRSATMKGVVKSPESIAKRIAAVTGVPMSAAARENMRIAQTGKTRSAESIAKRVNSIKARDAERKAYFLAAATKATAQRAEDLRLEKAHFEALRGCRHAA